MFHVGDIILPEGRICVNPGGWTVNERYFDLKERGFDESNVDGSELDNMFNEFE